MTTPIHEISTESRAGGVLLVRLAGDFDMSVSADLTTTLVRAVRQTGVSRVEVDLRRTAFLDSHGIAGLLAGYEAATLAGRGFTVTGAEGMVRQVLRITGLAEVFGDRPESAPAF